MSCCIHVEKQCTFPPLFHLRIKSETRDVILVIRNILAPTSTIDSQLEDIQSSITLSAVQITRADISSNTGNLSHYDILYAIRISDIITYGQHV